MDDIALITGATVNGRPLLLAPLTLTTTFPVRAPGGTGTAMRPLPQVVGVAAVPPKVTVLEPSDAPKFAPLMLMLVPTDPDDWLRLVMLGVGTVTVKFIPLLGAPLTVTTTFPVVAPDGTVVVMLEVVQLLPDTVAATPLKVTMLLPWLDPKFDPPMVTVVPTGPELVDRLVMLAVGRTVKATVLLATPNAVTVTVPLPTVAPEGTGTTIVPGLQLETTPSLPPGLKVTVPVDGLGPKFAPLIVIGMPTAAELGMMLAIFGVGIVTVKYIPVLWMPPTVTVTLPLVAFIGTGTAMLVPLQLVGKAGVPLNETVLVP